jgi:hypothetical protein
VPFWRWYRRIKTEGGAWAEQPHIFRAASEYVWTFDRFAPDEAWHPGATPAALRAGTHAGRV